MRLLSQPTAQLLPRFLRHPEPLLAQPTAATNAPASAPEAERASSCGWFDSSFDLNEGLEVTEERDAVLYQLWSQTLSGAKLH